MNYLEEFLNVMNKLEYFETMYAKYLNACEELDKTSDELVMKQITDEAITFSKIQKKHMLLYHQMVIIQAQKV